MSFTSSRTLKALLARLARHLRASEATRRRRGYYRRFRALPSR